MWVAQQNQWRRDMANLDFARETLQVLEMRITKPNKKQLIMESKRGVGMQNIRMRMEQLCNFRELRRGVAEGRVPIAPTNHAYQAGVTYGTMHRLNQSCQLDAIRTRKEIYQYMQDYSDAFGRMRHARLGADLIQYGFPKPMVFRDIVFWAFPEISIITSVGLTDTYTQDHAATQGDMLA
eukprot:gene7095-884_t